MLFGFLLAIRFTIFFDDLDDSQRYIYYATLLCTAVALVFYMAPAAHHRLRFRAGDKEFTMRKANREAIAGTVAAGLSFTGVLYLADRPHVRHAGGDRRRGRALPADRVALVGARALPRLARPPGPDARGEPRLGLLAAEPVAVPVEPVRVGADDADG